MSWRIQAIELSFDVQVAFRLDASRDIGIGHAVRCLALGHALGMRGARVRYVCRQLPASLRAQLESQGQELALLGGAGEAQALNELAHSRFLGASQSRDAEDALKALANEHWDWLIVDHYSVDSRWESTMRAVASRIMVIDDLADRVHDCDILLDQNLHSQMLTRYTGNVPPKTRLLLGPSYALLRPQFRHWRKRTSPRRGPVRRILVMFGGADSPDLTGVALRALERVVHVDLRVDVVVGAEHPRLAQTRDACAAAGYACHVQTAHMAELMAAADLAVGAGGSACWERCCLGLPAICASFADNQTEVAEALQSAGACMFLGDRAAATEVRFEAAVAALCGDDARLREMSSRAFALVDGCGTERVCDVLVGRA